MVLGYHLILTYYGFWLPNDPRGSWSEFVGAFDLLRYGDATKVTVRRSHAADAHDRRRRLEAKEELQRPPVVLDGAQCWSVAKGFEYRLKKDGVPIYALAVLPEHAHLVVGRGERSIEQLRTRLKAAAGKRLRMDGRHPLAEEETVKLFARGGWKVFIDDDRQMGAAVAYTERNPEKEGKPRQKWGFVKPYVPRQRRRSAR